MACQTPLEDLVAAGRRGLVWLFRDWRDSLSPLWPQREIRTFSSHEEITGDNIQHSSLLIVGPDEVLDPFQCLAIRQRLDIAVGLMPAAGPKEIESRIPGGSVEAPPTQRDILIDRTLKGPIVRSERRWIFPDGSLNNAEETIGLVSQAVRLLAVTSHGRNDVLYLPHSILCGQNPQPPAAADHRLAACGRGDGDCFYRGRTQVRLEQLQSKILFLNSCNSISGKNGILSPGFSLDAAVLRNRRISHFIGSPTIHHGEFQQSLLFSLLLNQGLSLGQALQLAEDTVVKRLLDHPSFLIYGDPETRFPADDEERMAVVDSDCLEHQSDRPLHLVLIPASASGNRILAVERAPAPTYLLPTRIGHFLFSNEGLMPGTYSWRALDLERFCIRLRKRCVLPLQRLKNIQILGVHPHRMSGRISDYENRLTQIRKGLRDLSVKNLPIGKLEGMVKKLSRKQNEVDRAILADLMKRSHEQAFHLSEIYRAECRVAQPGGGGDGRCDVCGEPTRETFWRHLVETEFTRVSVQCHRCGFLTDEPGDARIAAKLRPAGEVFQLGGDVVADLEFKDRPPRDGLIGCTILDIKRFGAQPASDVLTARSKRHRFVLKAPSVLPPHHFWLRAYLVREGQVYAWGANIWLSPAPSPEGNRTPRQA